MAVAHGLAGTDAATELGARRARGVPMTRCDRDHACKERIRAVASGDFRPNFVHGWVWRYAVRPNKPWTVCPWCGRGLPTMAEITDRVVYGAMQPEWDGEDGG